MMPIANDPDEMILIFKLFLVFLENGGKTKGKTEKIPLYNMNRKRSFGAYLSLIFVKILASLLNNQIPFSRFFFIKCF